MCVRPNPRCFTSCLKYKRMPCFGFPHKCRWYDTIDANDLILLKESYYEGKGVSLAKISDLNKPLCHQLCPFSQAGSVTPVLSPYKDRCKQDHGSPCDPWDLTSAHLISLISIRITVEVKLSPILGGASHFRFPESGILSHAQTELTKWKSK